MTYLKYSFWGPVECTALQRLKVTQGTMVCYSKWKTSAMCPTEQVHFTATWNASFCYWKSTLHYSCCNTCHWHQWSNVLLSSPWIILVATILKYLMNSPYLPEYKMTFTIFSFQAYTYTEHVSISCSIIRQLPFFIWWIMKKKLSYIWINIVRR